MSFFTGYAAFQTPSKLDFIQLGSMAK